MKPTKEQYLLAAKVEGLELTFEDNGTPMKVWREDKTDERVYRIEWTPTLPSGDAFRLLCAVLKYGKEQGCDTYPLEVLITDDIALAAETVFRFAVEIGRTM